MDIDLSRQSTALLLALLMGVGIGVVYDMLRPVRRRTGSVVGAMLDVLFCVASGCAAFIYAMGAGDGRLGVWELAAALLGFLLYMHTLSTWNLLFFTALLDALCRAAEAAKKIFFKALFLAKKALAHVRQWLSRAGGRIRRQKKEPPGEEPAPKSRKPRRRAGKK